MVVSLANSSARNHVSIRSTHCARELSHEWIREILRFPRNLVVPELHDAHGEDGLASYVRIYSVTQMSPPPMIRRIVNRFLLG